MKIPQHPYLSREAVELRRRDGIPPWGVHVCEVEHLRELVEKGNIGPAMRESWHEAERIKREIEGEE